MNVTLKLNVVQSMVQCAIDNQKIIQIAYTDREGRYTMRAVEPIRWVDGSIGFLTRCHIREGQYRHFKLKSIDRIIITDFDFCWVNPSDTKERVG